MSDTNEPLSFSVTPRELTRHLLRALRCGVVPFIVGSPGIGKSAIVKNVGKIMRLAHIDHRLSTSAPEDLSGLPKFKDNDTATFAPFDIFPIEDTPLPEGFDGWLLFLDEFNSAGKAIQAAAYKLMLDRMVGQKKLHPKVYVVAAGNHATDRAIVNPLSTAMQSRLVHLSLIHSVDEWLEDVAMAEHYDERIMAYISYKPSALFDFRPDHNDKTFCCPRTWEFMNRMLKGYNYGYIQDKMGNDIYEMDLDMPLFAGTITSLEAASFVQFTKVYKNLPDISQIMALPDGCPVPSDRALRFATIMHLLERVDDSSFTPIGKYITRFETEFRLVFFRGLVIRKKELKAHPEYRKMIGELSKYLNDD